MDFMKEIVLAFFGSLFPVILFNIDRKKLVWAGLCGVIGWATFKVVYLQVGSPIMASFCGAFMVGLYSEWMARRVKTPASMFSIPGIFPLVPGITAYNTLRFIVENNPGQAFSKGMETIAVGGAIGFGIMLASTLVSFVVMISKKHLDRA